MTLSTHKTSQDLYPYRPQLLYLAAEVHTIDVSKQLSKQAQVRPQAPDD